MKQLSPELVLYSRPIMKQLKDENTCGHNKILSLCTFF